MVMNSLKLLGVALVVVGGLALAYGGFSYTQDNTAIKLGPLELAVKEKKTVDIPLWAGVGALLGGGLCLVLGFRSRQ